MSQRVHTDVSFSEVFGLHNKICLDAQTTIRDGFAGIQEALTNLQIGLLVNANLLSTAQKKDLQMHYQNGFLDHPDALRNAYQDLQTKQKTIHQLLQTFSVYAKNLETINLSLNCATQLLKPAGEMNKMTGFLSIYDNVHLERTHPLQSEKQLDYPPDDVTFDDSFRYPPPSTEDSRIVVDSIAKISNDRKHFFIQDTSDEKTTTTNNFGPCEYPRSPLIFCETLYNTTKENPAKKMPGSTCFVFHVPATITEIQLRELFSYHGNVTECSIPKEPKNPVIGRGYAFVGFSSAAEANSAVKALNGYMFFGKRLSVGIKKSHEM